MSFRHTVIGTIGSDRDPRRAEEETLAALDELPPEHRQLIDGPVTVVVATRRRHGRATLSPVWTRAVPDGERLEINTVKGQYPSPFRAEGEERVLAYVRPEQIATSGAP